MPFQLVNISQQDPRWKNSRLGFSSSSTIGVYGCAMTSVCMWLSGFGCAETPDTLNSKLKQRGGFVQDAIVWGAVSAVYPQVKYKNLILCRDTDAPLDAIAASIAAGQPVILELDSSPKDGLQTHWVVAYANSGADFLILDPWPYPVEQGQQVSLMTRYSQGKQLKRAISAVVFYEYESAGAGPAPSLPVVAGNLFVRVSDQVSAGLRVRSAPNTASDTLSMEYPGSNLKVVEAEAAARPKIGVYGQWLRVLTPGGVIGYVAAWYVQLVPASPAPDPSPDPTPDPTPEPATEIKRVRPSLGDGLENIATPPAAGRRLTASAAQSGSYRLAADIWNRYGGILEALSARIGVEPGVAVATLGVESGGQAFGIDGRTLIRFENHLFYNYWGKNNQDKFNKFFTFNLNQRWMGHQWRSTPKGAWVDFHGKQAREWDVFTFARALDESAAMLSISMGAPQIMGFNYSVIGYASVQDMFAAFARSERDQVIAFFDFIQGVLPNAGAVKTLQAKNFLQFATVYNGSGQAPTYAGLINSGYNAFNALYASLPAGAPAPVPPVETPPITPPPVTAPVDPPPSTAMWVVVLGTAGKTGLALHKKPAHAANVLVNEPVGTVLRVKDEDLGAVRRRIGKKNEWIDVRDSQARRGFVLAQFVEEQKPSVIAPLSFDILELTAPVLLTVRVAEQVGKNGLRLRAQPNSGAPSLMVLPVNTLLQVIEPAEQAGPKVGVFNAWIKVKEPLGAEGFVAAWFLQKE